MSERIIEETFFSKQVGNEGTRKNKKFKKKYKQRLVFSWLDQSPRQRHQIKGRLSR
jgi:hypothetical protein